MLWWSLSFVCLALGARSLACGAFPDLDFLRLGKRRLALRRIASELQELEELLLSGLLPGTDRWDALAALPAPWGRLGHESVRELRAAGVALLPTLRRLRALAEEQEAALVAARARSSQAFGQAVVCLALVPGFGGILYALLPGVGERPWLWSLLCALAMALAAVGAGWMLAIADAARWGGLDGAERAWVLAAQCGGERFLALVRGGTPADLAWSRALELVEAEAPGLALEWGHSVWQEPAHPPSRGNGCGSRVALTRAGASIRRAVQTSLMEGRPCGERVEAVLEMLKSELRALVDRELALLASRTLPPLFACVAPAVLGLLAAALFLAGREAMGL